MRTIGWIFLLGWAATRCGQAPAAEPQPFSGRNPWPEIRKERIATLLGPAMERAGADAWLVLCRENDNDPLAVHVGGENAGGQAAFLFVRTGTGVHSRVYSPAGEATALRDLAIHDSVLAFDRSKSAVSLAFAWLKSQPGGRLAINFSTEDELADGLSHTQYAEIEMAAAGSGWTLMSATAVVYEWLSVKTPAEVDILREAAELTAAWQLEAYAAIVPGKTTDADVAAFLKAKMKAAGVTDAWAPDQNPNVNSGPDRGHSHATNRVIQPGDVIQTDFGIRVYGMWVTDIQRFAYVLKPGESAPPADIQRYWDVARKGSRLVLDALKPGTPGVEVDRAQRVWMDENGSEQVPWSTGHPVGYVAHDMGPGLGGARKGAVPNALQRKPVRAGMVFAYDGFYCWPIEDGTKTISVEEMAVVTDSGAVYLTRPQETLVLIKSRE